MTLKMSREDAMELARAIMQKATGGPKNEAAVEELPDLEEPTQEPVAEEPILARVMRKHQFKRN